MRELISPAQAGRHRRRRQSTSTRLLAGDHARTDRVRDRYRSGRRWASWQSLARPGGNATGFTRFEYEHKRKWLELLKEIAPHVPSAPSFATRHRLPGSAIRANSVGGAVLRRRCRSDRSARRSRYRTRYREVRALAEWRLIVTPSALARRASRPDHRAGGSTRLPAIYPTASSRRPTAA